jgi:hypothetical protein
MAALNVQQDVVTLSISSVVATDVFHNGILAQGATEFNKAVPSGGTVYNNGLLLTDAGQVRYLDTTVSGLPVDTVWTNGLPSSGGALCVSTGSLATYSNGIPFTASGAVRAAII